MLLDSVPAFGTLEYLHLPWHAERVDAATRAAASGACLHFPGAGVGDLIHWAVDRNDLRDQAARKLCAVPHTMTIRFIAFCLTLRTVPSLSQIVRAKPIR
jgi:hypothetical protein